MKKIALVYHSADLDGMGSAAVMKKFYNSSPELKSLSTTFIGWDYGNKIPDFAEYDTVVMADISFDVDKMEELRDTKEFIWIDHHAAKIKEVAHLKLKGLQNSDFSACELCWQYFFPNKETPQLIELLGKFDSFRHQGTYEQENVTNFQYGAQVEMPTYEAVYEYLNDWAISDYMDFKDKGSWIIKFLKKDIDSTIKGGLELEFEYLDKPKKFIAVNRERFNPAVLGVNYHKLGYDGFISFYLSDGAWKFSIYNEDGKIDVSKIAKVFGGGGHAGASGFRIEMGKFQDFISAYKL